MNHFLSCQHPVMLLLRCIRFSNIGQFSSFFWTLIGSNDEIYIIYSYNKTMIMIFLELERHDRFPNCSKLSTEISWSINNSTFVVGSRILVEVWLLDCVKLVWIQLMNQLTHHHWQVCRILILIVSPLDLAALYSLIIFIYSSH